MKNQNSLLISCVLLIIGVSCNLLTDKALFGSCKFYEFKCKSGVCIDEDLLCDGVANCQDQSDETSAMCSTIACPKFSFTCKYGACINLSHRCDGIKNCFDNSDEENCSENKFAYAPATSTPAMHHILSIRKYICKSGDIIDEDLICDGKPNCLDHSDETESLCSTFYCPYFTFRCKYGACISLNGKCNGITDCDDGSDERYCTSSSTTKPEILTTKPPNIIKTKFQCTSGEVIDDELLCDGEPDCADQSDETSKECANFECPSFSYRCNYGACVLSGAKCNGIKECADNSDETGCSISLQTLRIIVRKFQCNSGQIIDADKVCDGKADCTDISDEISTTCSNINCPRFAYQCNYGACVHGTARCNGFTECIDNSDEALCPIKDEPITKDQVLHNDYLIFT